MLSAAKATAPSARSARDGTCRWLQFGDVTTRCRSVSADDVHRRAASRPPITEPALGYRASATTPQLSCSSASLRSSASSPCGPLFKVNAASPTGSALQPRPKGRCAMKRGYKGRLSVCSANGSARRECRAAVPLLCATQVRSCHPSRSDGPKSQEQPPDTAARGTRSAVAAPPLPQKELRPELLVTSLVCAKRQPCVDYLVEAVISVSTVRSPN